MTYINFTAAHTHVTVAQSEKGSEKQNGQVTHESNLYIILARSQFQLNTGFVEKRKKERQKEKKESQYVKMYYSYVLSLQWLIGDRDSHCGIICSRTQGKPVCGSDGRSYETGCELQRARCKDRTLTLAHRGRCRGENGTLVSAHASMRLNLSFVLDLSS